MKEKLIDKKTTPVMKQYWESKKSYPDSIMLFRMGDFYETFEDDAVLTSKILGITLTKRSNGAASSVPLAGFPYHSLNQHVYKLLDAGHKIAICEQIENPKEAKGIIKRAVVEVLTPGTAIESKFLNNERNNFLISIFLNNNEFGFSIIDNSTGEFFCGKSHIVNLMDILAKYEIKEILIPKNQQKILDEHHLKKQYLITTYDDWKAENSTCYHKLINQFGTKSLKGFGIEEEPLCIIASGAAIYYLEDSCLGRLQHINSISILKDKGFMKLDSFTIKNLEIFYPLNNNDKKATLINAINYTVTSYGSRLLKQNLNRPLLDKKRISNRLRQLDDLFNNKNINKNIRLALKNTNDIQRILGKVSNNKANPRDVLQLAYSLKVIPELKKIVGKKTKSLELLLKKSKDLSKLYKKIINEIKEDPTINISKGNFINDNINKQLDNYRSIILNANSWLVSYQIKEQNSNNIPSLKIKYNKIFGYYIDITKVHLKKVPESYIRKQTLVNSERFYTKELKEYEEKVLNSEFNLVEIEKKIFEKIRLLIVDNIKKIQCNADILAKIDVLSSHAYLSSQNNYSKPLFSKEIKLELINSRHPVVEKLLPIGTGFVPNSIQMNKKNRQIAVITGPNMAGKSTFLRQVAHIVLLAQIGCYVPADYCELGIVDQLFTRVGASDNIAEGESTFLVEMNEAAYILNNSTKNSFIILDEIGRGTSTFDGLSLAWSIIEFIHNNNNINSRTLFATHYHELILLADNLQSAFNLNIEVKEYEDEIIFLRKIKEGGASKSYGIQVAEMAGVPKQGILRAKELLNEFLNKESKNINYKKTREQLDLFSHNNELSSEFKKIDLDNLTPLQALNILSDLKKKYDT